MRNMRLFALLLLLALLVGCGGGGNNGVVAQRTVTIVLQWPTSGRHVGRAAINPQSALVEVFDGTQRIGTVQFSLSGSSLAPVTQSLTVPDKDLTFYANGFSNATPPDSASYATDVTTGLLAKGSPGSTVPLALTDPYHPIAHAVTVLNIPALGSTPKVTFTWNNTIALLTQVAPTTTFSLSAGPQTLASTIQAQDATGAILLVNPSQLAFTVDPTDTLGLLRATIANGQLTPKATGTVRVIVQDTAVNSNPPSSEIPTQIPIQATVTYTITPAQSLVTIHANVTIPSSLSPTNPQYPATVQSVTFALTWDYLGGGSTSGDVLPAAPPSLTVPITAGTTSLSQDLDFFTNVGAPPASGSFYPNGRTFTLKVTAWSNPDGTGTLLGSTTTASGQTASNSPFTLPQITQNTVSQPIQIN